MATCKYCGKDAGFLRSVHKECQTQHDKGISQIVELIANKSIKDSAPQIKAAIDEIAKTSFLQEEELAAASVKGWQTAVTKALEDDVLSIDEELSLANVKEQLGLDEQKLDSDGSYLKLVKAAVIRDLLEGKIPQRVKIDGPVPFNLLKNEQIIWLFKGVKYYEERTRTTYQGAYSGVSIRVMKGVYYRTGGFKGNPVVTSSILHIDNGSLAVTEKNIYFAGTSKAFRIAYNKIVAFKPYNDGLGVQRDAQSAKPQIFGVEDGWFIHNLVVNLSNLGKA
jgi:hypothetical protein